MLSAPVSSLHKTDSGFVQMLAFGRSGREQAHFWFSEHVSSPKIKNISLFQKYKSGLYLLPSRPAQRGARDRHERGTGMRWTRMEPVTTAPDAYGKDVWS
jgi:hypothetical protein